MDGVADSSFPAEYCALSVGTKCTLPIIEILRFMGINPPPVAQYCDSTAAKQVALNPKSFGVARTLGIRMHVTRYAIATQGLTVHYTIIEDCVADMLTKRLLRPNLSRFATIFFNVLTSSWRRD